MLLFSFFLWLARSVFVFGVFNEVVETSFWAQCASSLLNFKRGINVDVGKQVCRRRQDRTDWPMNALRISRMGPNSIQNFFTQILPTSIFHIKKKLHRFLVSQISLVVSSILCKFALNSKYYLFISNNRLIFRKSIKLADIPTTANVNIQ